MKITSLILSPIMAVTLCLAADARGDLLSADGDFGAQTPGSPLGEPWTWAMGGIFTVEADAQSPFTNLFPDNGQGVSHGPVDGSPYFVQGGFNVPAGTKGYLRLNFDFRNTTADVGGWTVYVTKNASGNDAAVGLTISGTGFYAKTAGGAWSDSLFTPVVGEWYNVQVLLDLNDQSYYGTAVAHSTGAVIPLPRRGFVAPGNDINTIFSDSGSGSVGGTTPGHNMDNFALSTYVPPERTTAGANLAANEQPDGAGDVLNPNPTYPQWRYGYRATVAGTDLTLFTEGNHTDAFSAAGLNEPMEGFCVIAATIPAVLVNTSPMNYVTTYGAGPFMPKEMMMHGDYSGTVAVTRYTVPLSGSYNIRARVRSVHGGTADAYVVSNGVPIFSQTLPAYTACAAPTFLNMALQAGDIIDFAVGGAISTAFDAVVSLSSEQILTADGDFGLQTLGSPLSAPWGFVSSGHTVEAEAQSPFTSIFPDNGKGVYLPAVGPGQYFLQHGYSVPADATGDLFFSFDFRNTTADPDGWSMFVTDGGDPGKATIALAIRNDGFYARSSGAWSGSLFVPVIGEWYHVELQLNMNDNTYWGAAQTYSSGVVIPLARRSFDTENAITAIFSDGSSDQSSGIAPAHDIDNIVLASGLGLATVWPAPRTATAGADLAANEKPDGVNDWRNANATYPEWSYGYRAAVADTALTPFTQGNHTDAFAAAGPNEPLEGFCDIGASIPAALVNTDPANYVTTYGAGPFWPSEMMMHGTPSVVAVTRYTVLKSGSFNIWARFRCVHVAQSEAFVVSNGVTIFAQSLPPYTSTTPTFLNLSFQAGDVLDFVVGGVVSTAFDAVVAPASSSAAMTLTTDPDFGLQTLGGPLGAPWTWATSGDHVVDAAAQSPFTNSFADNGKGVSLPALDGNHYFVQQCYTMPAGAGGYLSLAFDFRNTTAGGDGWTVFATKNADGRLASLGLSISGDGFYALSSSGWSGKLRALEVGEWYHVELLLDRNNHTYSGSIISFGTRVRTPIPSRAFYTINDIDTLYSDGVSDGGGGIAPGHDIDNLVLSTVVPEATGGVAAGQALAANEKPEGATDMQNPNPTFPQWSYGYRNSALGPDLTLFTAGDHTDAFIDGRNEPAEGFNIHGGFEIPAVLVNTDGPFTFFFGAGPLGPEEMMLHGDVGVWSVVRYTVPASGGYDVVASFRPIQRPVAAVNVQVVANGVSLFEQELIYGQSAAPAFMNLGLQAGDVLDFVVGVTGGLEGDSTAFNATVMPAGPACAVPEVGTLANQPVIVPRESLLAPCVDLAGNLLSVFAVSQSASGAAVALVDGEALYTPLPDFVGADRFSYTVTDENGHYATRVVDVLVSPDTVPQPRLVDPQYTGGQFGFTLTDGVTGRSYQIARALVITGPWTNVATVVVGPGGLAPYVDTESPSGGAFYRAVYP